MSTELCWVQGCEKNAAQSTTPFSKKLHPQKEKGTQEASWTVCWTCETGAGKKLAQFPVS
jgi:hypothetical protein